MSMKSSTVKSAAAKATHLPPEYLEKRQDFLETKEKRLQEEIAAEHAVLLRRHDAIVSGFREQCVRMRQWETESQRRHKEDRDLYASRRAHEVELERIHSARLASIRARHHDADVSATEQNVAELEANIRRLGLDEERPPNATAAATAVVVGAETANTNRIQEIRRRKEVDIAARRDKLQRQYVAQQQQMLASKDVVRQQMIQSVVARASQLLVSDRDASLEAKRRAIEGDIQHQMAHVFLEGECTRRLAAFHETDKVFAVAAEAQRAEANAAFDVTRSEQRKLELSAKSAKTSGLQEFFGSFVDALVDVSVGVAVRNCVQLSDGTVLRRPNPPSAAEWRATKERSFHTAAVQDRIDQRKMAAARARILSNASPRVKRNSSVNLGSFSASLVAKPMSASGAGGIPGSLDMEGSPTSASTNMSPGMVPILDDVWDTEEADNMLEVVSVMDRNRFGGLLASAVASVHDDATRDFEAVTRTRLEEIEKAGQAKGANASAWWCNVLGELAPAAVFVFGDALSGVRLVSDARYVGETDEQYLLTPEKVSAQLAAIAAQAVAAQPPPSTEAVASAAAVSPSKPAKGKGPAAASGGGPRPTSASMRNNSGAPSSPVSPVLPQASLGDVVALVAKRIVKHHRHQLDALVRKDNTNGYPPSLLLAGFPLENVRFIEELNSALERELEEEEKSWAPLKVLMSLEHNTPRGGGGIGTHRSSIGGGGGHTNPNTPHGSLFNGGLGASAGGGGAPSLHSGGGGSIHENESIAASGPRHRPLPAAFSASAGKHHAAAMANQAATMFFPPVRIASVFLDLTTPNLVERYQRVLSVAAPGGKQAVGAQCFHDIWAPPPPQDAAAPTLAVPSGTVTQPIWQGMTPPQAHQWLDAMTSAWRTQKEGWVAAVGRVHRRAPAPATTTTPSSPPLASGTTLVSSSLAPPVIACSGRLSRIVHFIGHHPVDHLSAQDPHEVTAQILAQEVRALGKSCSTGDAGLAGPFLPPLKLSSFALPDASLDELLQQFADRTQQLTMWTLNDVADVANRPGTRIALAPFGDQAAPEEGSATATVSIAPALLQRMDDIKLTRNQNFRALRELEVESGRCLYHAYLYALTTLEEDAFMKVHADFSDKVEGMVGADERGLSQQYWHVCDAESARVRGILATLVGTLSGTMRQLQCVHLRTVVDTVCLGVEEVMWMLVATVLEAQKRRLEVAALQTDTADGSSSSVVEWFEQTTESLLADVQAAAPFAATVTDDAIAQILETVHDNGTVMVDGVHRLWVRLAQAVIPAASAVLQRACQAAGSRDGSGAPNALEAQLFSFAVTQFEQALKRNFLIATPPDAAASPAASSSFNAIGKAAQRHVATLVQHERLRKALSSGSSVWISHLFQHVSELRLDAAAVAGIPRPHTFEDVILPPEPHAVGTVPRSMAEYAADAVARKELVLSDVQVQHLMLHMALAAPDNGDETWCLDATEFQHFMLSVQVSGFHHYVPSSLEDCVAPMLALTRTAATARRMLVADDDVVPPPRLFLPAWWLASMRHVVGDQATGPRGHFFTQEAALRIFRAACGCHPDAAGAAGAGKPLTATSSQRVDASLWVCHVCTGQLEAPSYLLPNVAERTYCFNARRCATPNVLQLRVFVEALDACHRQRPTAVASWAQLPWWPLSSCAADATTVHNVSLLTVQQLLHVLSATNGLASSMSIAPRIPPAAVPLSAACCRVPLMDRCIRWLLSSAVSSGPSAVLEFAFAIAASIRGRLGTTEAEVVPQPLANPHSKAFVLVDVLASVLERYQSSWSADDFKLHLLFTGTSCAARVAAPASADGSDDESSSPSPQYAMPISERAEEISFSALNASHFGMHLLRQRRREAAATSSGTLPTSEIVL